MRALLLVLLALPLAACDSGGGGSAACAAAGISSTGTLTATAGGDAFEAVCVSGQVSGGSLSVVGLANLGEAGATQRQINITVPNAAVGTARISATGSGAIVTYAALDASNPTDPSGLYTATSGSVTVEALSTTAARGTFSFTGRNNDGGQIQVSEGSFDVTF